MQIKRFEAKDMSEALSSIKREFGPNAVILSARTIKKSGGIFSYMKRPIVEVTAAMDTYCDNDNIKPSFLRTELFQHSKLNRLGHNDTSYNTRPVIQSHRIARASPGEAHLHD